MSQSTDAYDMVKMIADSEKDQRLSLITERMKMIVSQPEEQRVQTIKGLLQGLVKLDTKRRVSFLGSLAIVLTERLQEARLPLMISRVRAGSSLSSDANNTIYEGMVEGVIDWPEDKRQMYIGDIEKAHDKLNMDKPSKKHFIFMLKNSFKCLNSCIAIPN